MNAAALKTRASDALRLALGLVVAGLACGFAIDSVAPTPDNAEMYVDDATGQYYSPPCVVRQKPGPLRATRMAEILQAERAHDRRFHPNAECRDDDGFMQNGRSVSGHALQRIGVLPPLRSRWNGDGSWNW